MTTLREAAQQALEALEDLCDSGAEAWGHQRSCVRIGEEAIAALRNALAQQHPESDPVGWQFRMRPDWVLDKDFWEPWTNCTKEQAADYQRVPHLHDWTYEVRSLFTHPPQRKPLTLEIHQPNESGSTLVTARWFVDTPHGWIGAWDREALEYILKGDE